MGGVVLYGRRGGSCYMVSGLYWRRGGGRGEGWLPVVAIGLALSRMTAGGGVILYGRRGVMLYGKVM